MFIAITFFCLVNGECKFAQDDQISTQSICQARNEALAQILEADPKVEAFQTFCVTVPQKVI